MKKKYFFIIKSRFQTYNYTIAYCIVNDYTHKTISLYFKFIKWGSGRFGLLYL